MSISLITMPWGQPVQPNLLMGNLQKVLEDKYTTISHSFHLEFSNFLYKNNLGLGAYQTMIGCYGLGDFIFSVPPLKKENKNDDKLYFEYLKQNDINEEKINLAIKIRSFIEDFLEHIYLEVCKVEIPDVFVFCPMYRELTPSLTFAKFLKSKHPEARIIFAGEVLEGELKESIKNNFNFIESVIDIDPEKNILSCLNNSTKTLINSSSKELDFLKTSNFDEYFERLDLHPLKTEIWNQNWIPFETSRGCWWAEKSKCTFCALTKSNSLFRKQSVEEIIEKLIHFSNKYGVLKFQFFDWIISYSYFEDLFPQIAKLDFDFTIYLQSKVNLDYDQLKILKKIGTVVQFGVESLNTDTLKKIKKGATAFQNILALKRAAELNLRAEWNLLYDLPCQNEAEYSMLLDLLPSLFHLWPPSFNRFRLQKLSPYYEDDSTFGLKNNPPLEWYNYVYSFLDTKDIKSISEELHYAKEITAKETKYLEDLRVMIGDWNKNTKSVYRKLQYLKGPNFIRIIDLRFADGRKEYMLEGIESVIYMECNSGSTINSIAKSLFLKKFMINESEILNFLNLMCKQRLMYQEDNKYLALALAGKCEDN